MCFSDTGVGEVVACCHRFATLFNKLLDVPLVKPLVVDEAVSGSSAMIFDAWSRDSSEASRRKSNSYVRSAQIWSVSRRAIYSFDCSDRTILNCLLERLHFPVGKDLESTSASLYYAAIDERHESD